MPCSCEFLLNGNNDNCGSRNRGISALRSLIFYTKFKQSEQGKIFFKDSRFLEISADEWDIAALLPMESFVGATASKVHAESQEQF